MPPAALRGPKNPFAKGFSGLSQNLLLGLRRFPCLFFLKKKMAGLTICQTSHFDIYIYAKTISNDLLLWRVQY